MVRVVGELHATFGWAWSCRRLSNFARNSLVTCSNIEITSLELQRFWAVSKNDRLKLRAKFVWAGSCRRPPAPCIGLATAHRHCPGSVPRSPPVPSTPVPPAPSTQVGPGVLLCRLARYPPRVRYKILPAQLLGGDNGTKLSLHIEKAPNRAISGEQGEFSTGSGAVRLVLGEFCTAHAVGRGVLGEFCTGSGPPLGPVAGLSRSWALGRGLPDPQVRSTTVAGGGFALHEALLRRVAGVSHPLVVQFPPSRGLPDERGTQNADHLGEKH